MVITLPLQKFTVNSGFNYFSMLQAEYEIRILHR